MLKRKKRGVSVEPVGYLFIAPLMLFIFLWKIFPIGYLTGLSFFRWDLISLPRFVGFQNYVKLIHSPNYWSAFFHTFIYIGAVLGISITVALILAVIFNGMKVKGRIIFLTIAFIPYIISESAAGYMWMWILEEGGLLNFYLTKIGFAPIHWLSFPGTAMFSIVAMSSWRLIGYNTIIFFIGLQAIPDVYYEAAKIDGSDKLRMFWNITLPLLKPMMLYILVIAMVAVSQAFTPVYVLTGGGPYGSTDVLLLRMYRMAFENYEMGYAGAISITLTIVLASIMYLQFKYLKSD